MTAHTNASSPRFSSPSDARARLRHLWDAVTATPKLAYPAALLLAAAGIAACLSREIGVALIVGVLVFLWISATVRQPMNGILSAFAFYPVCALLRSGHTAYNLPIWAGGVRLFPEACLMIVFVSLLIRACNTGTRFRFFSDDLPVALFLLSGVYGFVLGMAYLPLVGPLNGWWVSMTPTVFYFAVRFINPTPDQVNRFLRFFLISFTLLGIGSFYQYIVRPEWLILISQAERPQFPAQTNLPPDIYWRVYMRMESLLMDENVWGTLCAFVSLFCLTGLRGWKTPWKTILVLLVALGGMVFSMSRGSWLTFTIGVLALLLMRGRHRGRIVAALLVIGVVGSFVVTRWGQSSNTTSILTRAGTLTSSDAKNNASSDRSFQWKAGWDIFVRNPSGTGLGTVGYAAHLSGVGGHIVADGIYFRILAETGVPGALLTLSALFGTGWVLFRHIFDYACSPPTRRLGLALFAFHCGFVVQSLGANTYDYWYVPSLFWMLFGVFVSLCQREQAQFALAAAKVREA